MGILSGLTRSLGGASQRGRTTTTRGRMQSQRGRTSGGSPLLGALGGMAVNSLLRGGRGRRGGMFGRRRRGGLGGTLLSAALGAAAGRRRRY